MVASMQGGPAQEYSRMLLELHESDPKGTVDLPALDAVCDRMEDPWSRMAGREKKLVKGLSQDLYALADERQGVEMPTVDKVRWQQDGEALLAADDLAGLLEHLRRPFPAGMPKDYIWFLQARCWSRLGFVEAALAFMRAAGRTLPQARLACLHYLVQLDKKEEAIRFGEPLLEDPSLRPGDIYYVASVLFLTARSLEGSTRPVVLPQLIPALRTVLDKELKKPPLQRDPAGLELQVARLLAFALYRMSDYGGAVAACSAALHRFPGDPGLLCARGMARFQTDQAAAEADFERAVDAQPAIGAPYGVLAWYRVRQGRYRDVLKLSSRAFAFSDISPVSMGFLHEWRGIAYAELGQSKDWVDEEFAQALKLDPEGAPRINHNWQTALESVSRRNEGHPARKPTWTIAFPGYPSAGIDPTAQIEQSILSRVSAFSETDRMSLVGAGGR